MAQGTVAAYVNSSIYFSHFKKWSAPTTCHFRLLLRRARYSRHERVDTFDACGPIEVYVLQRRTCCLWKLRITLLQARANVRVSMRSVMLFNCCSISQSAKDSMWEDHVSAPCENSTTIEHFTSLHSLLHYMLQKNSHERLFGNSTPQITSPWNCNHKKKISLCTLIMWPFSRWWLARISGLKSTFKKMIPHWPSNFDPCSRNISSEQPAIL